MKVSAILEQLFDVQVTRTWELSHISYMNLKATLL